MTKHQLPTLNVAETFEDFVCDLFNQIENTQTFKNLESLDINKKELIFFG